METPLHAEGRSQQAFGYRQTSFVATRIGGVTDAHFPDQIDQRHLSPEMVGYDSHIRDEVHRRVMELLDAAHREELQ